MDKKVLKSLLCDIKDCEYKVPENINPYDLSLEMVEYLGDADGEMRNDLAFDVLVTWIMTDVLTADEAHKIYEMVLDEKRIFEGLGEINDTVFGRSFCVEVVACITYKHREYLSESDILKAFDIVLKLYNEDKDVRGFIEGKSWAHGAAHGADALAELAQCQIIGYERLKKILDSIHRKVNVNHYGYINNEDERMITAFKEVLNRDIIPIEEIEKWITSFGSVDRGGKLPDKLFVEHNITHFLKSLYFRLVNHSKYDLLSKLVKEVLKETSRFGEDYAD